MTTLDGSCFNTRAQPLLSLLDLDVVLAVVMCSSRYTNAMQLDDSIELFVPTLLLHPRKEKLLYGSSWKNFANLVYKGCCRTSRSELPKTMSSSCSDTIALSLVLQRML